MRPAATSPGRQLVDQRVQILSTHLVVPALAGQVVPFIFHAAGHVDHSRPSVAAEVPCRHRNAGHEVVLIDEVEDALISGSAGVRRSRGVRRGKGIGKNGFALVDELGGQQVGDRSAARMAGDPENGVVCVKTVFRYIGFEVGQNAVGGNVEALVILLARPVGIAVELAGIADVKVAAPFLDRAVCAADDDGNDLLGLAVVGHGAMAKMTMH